MVVNMYGNDYSGFRGENLQCGAEMETRTMKVKKAQKIEAAAMGSERIFSGRNACGKNSGKAGASMLAQTKKIVSDPNQGWVGAVFQGSASTRPVKNSDCSHIYAHLEELWSPRERSRKTAKKKRCRCRKGSAQETNLGGAGNTPLESTRQQRMKISLTFHEQKNHFRAISMSPLKRSASS
jgi:hypothetical protein